MSESSTTSAMLKQLRKSSGAQEQAQALNQPQMSCTPRNFGLQDRMGRRDIRDDYFRQILRSHDSKSRPTSHRSNSKSGQRKSLNTSQQRSQIDGLKIESFVRNVHIQLSELGNQSGSLTERLPPQKESRQPSMSKNKSSKVYDAVRNKLPVYERNLIWEKSRQLELDS